MKTMGKWVTAMFAALILGFGAGELLGPGQVAAGSFMCPQQICYVQGGGGYTCNAAATESWCDWVGGGSDLCRTRDCDCPPEDPECHTQDPPD